MSRSTLRTKFCDIMGVEYPIVSAGMGPSLIGERTGATPDLVVAVSEAGGLGVLGAAGFTVDEMRDAIREVKSRTDKPFGVDVLLPAARVAKNSPKPLWRKSRWSRANVRRTAIRCRGGNDQLSRFARHKETP